MIYKIRRRNGFAQISNAALRDTRLSYCARGILAMVMSHNESWKTTTTWIRSQTPSEGQVAIANAIKQLQQFGYLVIQREKAVDGKMQGCVWTWTDEPELLQADEPHSRIPDDGSPVDEDLPPSEEQCSQGHNEEEKTVAAEAAPLPPEELRSLKAKPDSPTPSSAPTPSPCPWHLTLGVSLPEPLRTQNCLEAARLWLQHKKEKNQKYSTVGFRRMVAKWGKVYNPITFVRAVEYSVETGWAGLFPHPDDKGSRSKPATPPPSSEPDPFDNKPTVTLADINAKFGYGQASVMWAKRMREQGRMR